MTDEIKNKIEEIRSKTNVSVFLNKIKEMEGDTEITDEVFMSKLTDLEKGIDDFIEYNRINKELLKELDALGFGYKDHLVDKFNTLIDDNYSDIYSVMGGHEYINKMIVESVLNVDLSEFKKMYDFSMKWDVTPLYPDTNTFRVSYRVGEEDGTSRGFTWFYNFSGVLYERKFDFLK